MVLGNLLGLFEVSSTGLSPSLAGLSRPFNYLSKSHVGVPRPRKELLPAGLGCFPFARRYLGNRMLLSIPRATEMFQLAPLAVHDYVFIVH